MHLLYSKLHAHVIQDALSQPLQLQYAVTCAMPTTLLLLLGLSNGKRRTPLDISANEHHFLPVAAGLYQQEKAIAA